MPITTSVPSNKLKPGRFSEFNVSAAARGLLPVLYRVVLIGCRGTGLGTATNLVPYQVGQNPGDGDGYFGQSSELALMVRAALKAGKKYGASPDLWAIALADPAGVKATHTITITGPATASGDLVITVAGRTVTVAVTNGDAQNTIATALNAALLAMAPDLPAVSTVATNVVTLTHAHIGVNGNDLRGKVRRAPAGVTATWAAVVAGTGAAVISAATDVLNDKHYDGVAVANHTATDLTTLGSYLDTQAQPATKRFGFAFLAETTSLSAGNTLATTANRHDIVVGNAELWPEMTGEIAAQLATTAMAETDPALPFDSTPLALYAPDAVDVPTDAEIETALNAGATILSVNDSGAPIIVRLVTTKTTLNSAGFLQELDFTTPKTLFYMAAQVDAAEARFQLDPRNKKSTKGSGARLRSMVIDIYRKAEKAEVVQNVDLHLGEFVVESDPVVVTRRNVALPTSVVPNGHQIVNVFNLIVEAPAA